MRCTKKFNEKYRIDSSRWKRHDYGENGTYFITICTKNKKHYFGKIIPANNQQQTQMQYSSLGYIARNYWLAIPNHHSDITLGEYIVMPNHLHGIVMIKNITAPIKQKFDAQSKWHAGIIGLVINQYKRACTLAARKINRQFAWQSRFYDHVIRSDIEFYNISEYIIANPQKWETDKYLNIKEYFSNEV